MNLLELIIAIILGAIGLALVFGGALALDYASCRSKSTAMNVEHSYGPLQGCMVRVNGRWLPIESVREVNP